MDTFFVNLWREQKAVLIVAALALLALASCLIVVDETKQAVIVRLGEPNRVVNRFRPNADFGQTGAGIVWRIPFLETVVMIDKRVLDVDLERQQVTSAGWKWMPMPAFA